jgi:uncharacterized CHY-type Zn-finger protein
MGFGIDEEPTDAMQSQEMQDVSSESEEGSDENAIDQSNDVFARLDKPSPEKGYAIKRTKEAVKKSPESKINETENKFELTVCSSCKKQNAGTDKYGYCKHVKSPHNAKEVKQKKGKLVKKESVPDEILQVDAPKKKGRPPGSGKKKEKTAENGKSESMSDKQGKRKRAQPDFYKEVKQEAKKRRESASMKARALNELDEKDIEALARISGAKSIDTKASVVLDNAVSTLVQETVKHSASVTKNGKQIGEREVKIAKMAQGLQE